MTKTEPESKAPASRRRHLPAAVVAIAVLGTGVATAWALSRTDGAGPQVAWNTAQTGVASVWAGQGSAPPPGQVASPGQPPAAAASAQEQPARTVAGLPGVPTIMWGAQRPHPDRGACASCHNVVKGDGRPVPQITSFSAMPHEFRGNCTNCHQISVAGGFGRPVGGTVTAPAPQMNPIPTAPMMQPAPAAGGPNEAEWRGMEVRPTPQGVMVTKADGTAARQGVVTGDLVGSINGTPIRTIPDFITATGNGNLTQGTMIATRGNERLAFELGPAAPGTTGSAIAGPATQPMAGMAPTAAAPMAGMAPTAADPMAGMAAPMQPPINMVAPNPAAMWPGGGSTVAPTGMVPAPGAGF